MRFISAPHNREREFDLRPAVTSFADECTAVVGRLLAYLGCLALLAIAAVAAFNHLELDWMPAGPKAGRAAAGGPNSGVVKRSENTVVITGSYGGASDEDRRGGDPSIFRIVGTRNLPLRGSL